VTKKGRGKAGIIIAVPLSPSDRVFVIVFVFVRSGAVVVVVPKRTSFQRGREKKK
jgi:hypothetical protein